MILLRRTIFPVELKALREQASGIVLTPPEELLAEELEM